MKYDFRLDILRDSVRIGQAFAESVKLTFNYSSSVMKGIQFDFSEVDMSASGLEFNMFRDRIRPILITDGTEQQLGVFMIMAAPLTRQAERMFYSVEGYDETMIVKQAAFETRQYYAAGTNYVSIVQSLLVSLGFTAIRAVASAHVLAEDLDVEAGTSYLDLINKLLDAINYQHLYADAYGTLIVSPIVQPSVPQFIYRDSSDFNLLPPVKLTTDLYDLPNVVVGVYSSPDTDTPIVYKTENNNPLSLISTVSRGYRVVQTLDVWNIASQEEMEAYVERIAFDAMQATEQIQFTSPPEAGHEPNAALQVDTDMAKGLFIEKGWEISVSPGSFTMHHTAERKVFV